MEFNGHSRFRHPKSPSTDRFIGVYPHAPHPSSSSTVGEELNEDDIFLSDNADCSNSPGEGGIRNPLQRATSLSSSPLNHESFPLSDKFGILAAIHDASRPNSHFFRKLSVSSASASSSSSSTSAASSSSRLISSIPKPPQERVPIVAASSSSSCLGIYHQSAPVNVPNLAKAMRKNREFDDDFDSEVEGEGEMLPPH